MSVPRCRWASNTSTPAGSCWASARSYCPSSSSAFACGSTGPSLVRVCRVPDVLIYGDTFRSPELRHEIPIGVPDPFLYAERDGARHVMTSSLELPRLRELGGLELHTWEDLGFDDLVAQGVERHALADELVRRAVRTFGVTEAVVPVTFPLHIADILRAEGVELRADRVFFDERRRVKSEAELAGIRRAQRAAEAGMDAARDLLRRAQTNGAGLEVDGARLP